MSTNYTRIPTASEMDERKYKLLEGVANLDMSPSMIERSFAEPISDSWEHESVWDKFIDGTKVHLGKRSSGWKFCWNFHNNKYYSNKEELLAFIRSGRVVDEYGDEQNIEEFIKMALEWGEADGLVVNKEYRDQQWLKARTDLWLDSEKYDDLIIDGLRISSSTEFS